MADLVLVFFIIVTFNCLYSVFIYYIIYNKTDYICDDELNLMILTFLFLCLITPHISNLL